MKIKQVKVTLKDGKPQAEVISDDGNVVGIVEAALPERHSLEDVEALRGALAAAREEAKTATAVAKLFDGLDAKEARDALEKVKSGSVKSAKEVEEFKEAFRKELEAKVAADLKAAKDVNDAQAAQLRALLVDQAAATAVAEHKGRLKVLMPMIRSHARVETAKDGSMQVVIVGDDGKPMLTKAQGKTDPMGIAEFVAGLKSDAEWAGAFEGSGRGGSGGGGGIGVPSGGSTDSGGAINPNRAVELLNRANERTSGVPDGVSRI